MILLPVTNCNIYTIISECDYELLSNRVLSVYAKKYVGIYDPKIKRTIPLHRYLLEITGRHIHVDHKDRNPFNNQRCNLRICTNQQNTFNSRPRPGKSIYKGVTRHRDTLWRAYIVKNGKQTHIGVYEREDHAAIAYNRMAIEFFGEFAYLNDVTIDGDPIEYRGSYTSQYKGIFFDYNKELWGVTKDRKYFKTEAEAYNHLLLYMSNVERNLKTDS